MNFTVETLEPQAVLGIRVQVKMSEIGDKIGELMPELSAFAGSRIAGPPLARWHKWEDDEGEMEVAVPVTEMAEGQGRIEASELPGGPAAVAIHIGPYDGLKATWTALAAWMKEQGHEGSAAPWEQYVSDCYETPAHQLETRIVWPIG
ncbi:MAG: GyrI-like domain-containing protein [Planctomycetota bacterium]|jgi:AraC family transcriptional regulator